MADACMVCGKINTDWRRQDGFLCPEHWKLVPAALAKRYNAAQRAFALARKLYHDKDHPKRDAASGRVVEIWREIKAIVEDKAAGDLLGRAG